jgi:hypothetical protein
VIDFSDLYDHKAPYYNELEFRFSSDTRSRDLIDDGFDEAQNLRDKNWKIHEVFSVRRCEGRKDSLNELHDRQTAGYPCRRAPQPRRLDRVLRSRRAGLADFLEAPVPR